jgi:predicted unusual protein kinase regulating ubiquinone biosynthesis (AarF/ABC1/UbiB family)
VGIISRAASLASVPVKTGAKIAGAATATAFGADRDTAYAKAAESSVETLTKALSKARGPALKFGQILALFSSTLPDDQAHILESLTQLYENATPRPYKDVKKIIDRELPPGVSVDPNAVAAASLGQVHKGKWVDGSLVAIKIQYPDAKRIVKADMIQLKTMVPFFSILLPSLDIKALLNEHSAKLFEELDYRHEAEWQEKFRTKWEKENPGIITIPKVLFCSENVLVSEWLEGTPYIELQKENSIRKDQAGKALARFVLWSPHLVGAGHADPHPGNYRLLENGSLGVLDFGSVAAPSGAFTTLFAKTFDLAEKEEYEKMHSLWLETGLIQPDTTIQELLSILDIDLRPYTQEEFTFTKEWIGRRAEGFNDPIDSLKSVSKLSFPPSLLLEHRGVTGMLALLASLDATIDFRRVLQEINRITE